MALSLRTKATEERYRKFREKSAPDRCPFCVEEPLRVYKHWLILQNNFPYDNVFKVSHLLAPRRHQADLDDLSWRERWELRQIRRELLKEYHVILENGRARRTKKHHYHLHLLMYKD